jgi:hypothetical protein
MIPPHSITLWYSDNQIRMHVPPSQGTLGHSLTFTDDLVGWARIKTILRERAKANDLRLAVRGTPTQSQLAEYDEKAVKRPKPKFKVAPGVAQAAKEVMRRMGMI